MQQFRSQSCPRIVAYLFFINYLIFRAMEGENLVERHGCVEDEVKNWTQLTFGDLHNAIVLTCGWWRARLNPIVTCRVVAPGKSIHMHRIIALMAMSRWSLYHKWDHNNLLVNYTSFPVIRKNELIIGRSSNLVLTKVCKTGCCDY